MNLDGIHRTSPVRQNDPRASKRTRGPAPPPPPRWSAWLIALGLLLTVFLLFRPIMTGSSITTLPYSQFVDRVTSDQVKTATISANGLVTGALKTGGNYQSQLPVALPNDQLAQLLLGHHVQVTGEGPATTTLLSVIVSFLPLLLFVGVFLYLGRRAGRQLAGGLGSIGGNRAKLYDAERPTTRFDDVAGYEGAKREVQEVVEFLKYPNRYKKIGAVGPRGVLLVGPPGTGKTLLARAVAGEASVPFYSVTGSSFVEMFVGVGAARVRDLFGEARKRAPAIIFIDEIDAIGQRRGGTLVANDEREQTLNQMLAEMDGFDPSTGVVVMAATNRPEILDPALLRPGRFDRQVEIPLPNQRERAAILGVHAKGKVVGPDVDLEVVARSTPGFSGADLANLVNEAAIFAIRAGREAISAVDFQDARDRILIGRRDATNALMPEEKRAVAVHEAGHTLVAVFSERSDPVAKVTILPAGQALGVTEQLPEDERHLYPEGYLLESLAIRMGGRCAERLVLGEVSTGAANDLAGATQLARRMVLEFGMSPRLGPVGFSPEGPQYLGPQEFRSRPYAEDTQRVVDEETRRLLGEAEQRATDLLEAHRADLDRLVDLLLERETVDGAEVYALLGRTPPSDGVVVAPAVAHAARSEEKPTGDGAGGD
jgi:cell division protease FtsH